MKNNFKFLSAFLLIYFGGFTFYSSAQSDYQIVQNFKKKSAEIEKQIEKADSQSELEEAALQINELQREYKTHKPLLDDGLYPEDFNKIIDNLNTSVSSKEDSFGRIEELEEEVVTLKVERDKIYKHNSDLLKQLESASGQARDDKKIAQLESQIAELRASLQQRDELLMKMIENLLPASYKKNIDISEQEKQQVYAEAEKRNIAENIKQAIRDNIQFINITSLSFNDIINIKERKENFENIWRDNGPQIIQIYFEQGARTAQLSEIDSAFSDWHYAIEQEVWTSINSEFARYNILLPDFSDGKDFTTTLVAYIQNEIRNIDAKGESESNRIFTTFTDSVWYRYIEPEWTPFLIKNGMITESQVDSINANIDEWENRLHPAEFNWLYIALGLLIIIIIAAAYFFYKRKRYTEEEEFEEEEEP